MKDRRKEYGDLRTIEEIQEHYTIEKDLARQLLEAPRDDRRYLYSSLYDELFRRVPRHPQLARKISTEGTAAAVSSQLRFLRRFLNDDTVFLEIGPGDCALSFGIASLVKKVYAVDVSEVITSAAVSPSNFELLLCDGASIPLPSRSIDVAYSNQLMEHLHPEDAFDQLRDVHRVLAPGGIYVCITPNRLTGPHDISKYFDDIATGFHLREYSATELRQLFRTVGFAQVHALLGAKGIFTRAPTIAVKLIEGILSSIPREPRLYIARRTPFRFLVPSRMIARKQRQAAMDKAEVRGHIGEPRP